MIIDDIHERANSALAALCERQDELSLAAHLALMDAFNQLAGDGLAPQGIGSPAAESIAELLIRARTAVDFLVLNAADLRGHLQFLELRDLIDLAIRES